MKIYKIFESFFAREKLFIHNDSIIDYCLRERENSFTCKQLSNNGGWHSESINLEENVLGELVDEIHLKMLLIKQIFDLKQEVKMFIGNAWININNKNSFNMPHVHPKSLVSMVYYAKVPENSGKLMFDNPIPQHNFVISSDVIQNFNTLNSGYWGIQPEANELVMFPAWIKHWVEPNKSDEERISIAFNIQID